MVLIAASTGLTAEAQSAPDDTAIAEARAHFEAGTAAFDQGDYELAVSEFEAAHAITAHPDILFNIYSAAERAGQLELALGSLERYLAEGEVPADRRTVLQGRLARLRDRVAAQRAGEPDPGAETVTVDEATEATPAPIDTAPAPEPAPAPAPAPSGVHPAGIGVLIGAGVLLASFAVFASLSEVEDQRLETTCASGCADDELSTLGAYNVVADVSWIGAAALGVVGVVLLIALPPESGDDVAALPWISPDGAGVALAGRLP